MKKQIKELRVSIDGLAQLTKELHRPKEGLKNSNNWRVFHPKETEKVVDNLYLAKAWLGKVLGELGEATPYANDGKRKTVADIEPTADVATKVTDYPVAPHNWNEGEVTASHIEKVDWLRQEIKNLTESLPDYLKWTEEQVDNFYKTVEENSKEDFCKKEEEFIYSLPNLEFEFNLVYKYLSEARFWLGFELARYKEENENK